MKKNRILPNIWGQGAIFAYSGLDGENTFRNSLVGYLSADHIGIHFRIASQCTLYFQLHGISDVQHKVVASDLIQTILTGNGTAHTLEIIFAAQNVILMRYPALAEPQLIFGREVSERIEGDMHLYKYQDETLAFVKRKSDSGTIAALSYGENAQTDALSAMDLDIDQACSKKLAYFDALPPAEHLDDTDKKLLYKCFSVMKSMVYTPEGIFTTRWTTPDRLPHKKLWLWDSVFHSFGNKYIDPQLAKETLLAVLHTQQEDGMIPHMSSPSERSQITQPPILAWGVSELYKYTGDKDFLAVTYLPIKQYLLWIMENRDQNKNWLYEWFVDDSSTVCRCDECGMDNSPRFDHVTTMDCIDFSCFMAKEALCMQEMAAALNYADDVAYWKDVFEKIKWAVNAELYDEADGFYYDRVHCTGKLKKVKAVSSFLPLFAEICDADRAAALYRHLCDENEFASTLPIPSVSMDDANFSDDMWRGAVWINYNYMVADGLAKYGYTEKSKEILKKTVSAMRKWYLNDGTIFEYYDPKNEISSARMARKGPNLTPYMPGVKMQSIRDYGWSCTLCAAILMGLEKTEK